MFSIVTALALTACTHAVDHQQPDCTTVGTPVALQFAQSVPIVAGRDGQLLTYSEMRRQDQPVAVDSKPPVLRCTPVRGVVGFAATTDGSVFLADARQVHFVPAGAITASREFSPPLEDGESISAIALLPSGQIELALSGGSAHGKPVVHFNVYQATSLGKDVVPLRSFEYDDFPGAVTITIDSQGRTYATGDAGEIAVFAPDARGRISKPLDVLNVTLKARSAMNDGPPRLALDFVGNLYCVRNASILMFESRGDSAIPPDEGHVAKAKTVADSVADVGRIAGVATDDAETLYVLSSGAKGWQIMIFYEHSDDGFSPLIWETKAPLPVP